MSLSKKNDPQYILHREAIERKLAAQPASYYTQPVSPLLQQQQVKWGKQTDRNRIFQCVILCVAVVEDMNIQDLLDDRTHLSAKSRQLLFFLLKETTNCSKHEITLVLHRSILATSKAIIDVKVKSSVDMLLRAKINVIKKHAAMIDY